MHLNDQIVASILLRQPRIIRLDQINLERLAENHDHMLDQPIHLDYELHHVLAVLLVRLYLVQFQEVICVCLE